MSSWVKVRAPVRALDAGGWTDTWFARGGAVCHLCLSPGAEAYVRMSAPDRDRDAEVQLRVPAFDDHYKFSISSPPGRHPLLEATLRRWAPPGSNLDVVVSSAVPAGSSLGTSAAVVVALVTALEHLTGRSPGPSLLAHAAHDVETVDLGRQSGVQDQVAAAFGGANLVRVDPYPHFEVTRLKVPPAMLQALSQRVVTVYLGSHDSSAVHTTVIERLAGDDDHAARTLGPMRSAAVRAADALLAGNLAAYGEAMVACTQSQAGLHPTLVNPVAARVIELATRLGALGWKVNGAGGPGGTVSVVGPEDPGELVAALKALEGLAVLPLSPAAQGACIVDGD